LAELSPQFQSRWNFRARSKPDIGLCTTAFRKVYKKADHKAIQVALHESFIAAIHGENN
jgi:hypothetical protein